MQEPIACQLLLWEFYHDNSEVASGLFQAFLISFPSLLLSGFSYIWPCITMAADTGPYVWLRHHPAHFSSQWVIMSPTLHCNSAENRLTFLLKISLGRTSVIISQNAPFILWQNMFQNKKKSQECWELTKWIKTVFLLFLFHYMHAHKDRESQRQHINRNIKTKTETGSPALYLNANINYSWDSSDAANESLKMLRSNSIYRKPDQIHPNLSLW